MRDSAPDFSLVDFSVVGGGIAGLVVARRLALAGARVTVHEASTRLGGAVARHTVAGIELDAGAEAFATRGGTVAELVDELGLGGELVEPAAAGAWLQPVAGRAVPLPATSLLGIPARPLARDVVAAIGLGAALRAQLDVVLPADRRHGRERADPRSERLGTGLTEQPGGSPTAGSLGELVRRRMGSGVHDRLVRPVVRGVHSTHPGVLRVDRVAPGLTAALRQQRSLTAAMSALRADAPPGSAVGGITGGMFRLVDALTADLDRLGVEVRLNGRVGDPSRLPGRAVLAAAPVGARQRTRRVVLATLVVDQEELDAAPRGTGVLVAGGRHDRRGTVRARALTHATAKWGWLRERSGGRHVLRLSYDHDRPDLAEVARLDAQTLLGVAIPADCVDGFARTTWTRPAAPDPASGAGGTTAVAPGWAAVTGEGVAGIGLAAVIDHADRVADRLLTGWSGTSGWDGGAGWDTSSDEPAPLIEEGLVPR